MNKVVKFDKTENLSPCHVHSLLSATKHLGKIRLHTILTVLVESLKFFLNKPKFNILKRCSIFFMLTASKNIKIHRAKFEVVLVKIVTNFYFLRIIDYGWH